MYREDSYNAGDLKVCPKITHRHIYPSNMDKMRIKLATQIFSRSMAGGLEYYHGVELFKDYRVHSEVERPI